MEEKIIELLESVASLKTSVDYHNQEICALRKSFDKSQYNPVWIKLLIATNGVVAAWLTVLSVIVYNIK